MSALDLQPFIWRAGTAHVFQIGATYYSHCFGGPLACIVTGFPEGQRPLHRVLTLDLADPRLGITLPGVRLLPLVYGLVFDGCELRYQVISDTKIQILEMTPNRSSENWPYSNYPASFKPVPLNLSERQTLSLEQVSDAAWQGIDASTDDDMIVIVPPSASYGVSLWGDGDTEGVQIVFHVQLRHGIVSVSNQCG